MTKINEIKKYIMELEEQKRTLTEEYNRKLKDIENKIKAYKVDMADLILEEQEAEQKDEVITFVSIKFNSNAEKTYDYIYDGDEEIHPGDMVEVESRWNGFQEVEVVNVCQEPLNKIFDLECYKHAYPLN